MKYLYSLACISILLLTGHTQSVQNPQKAPWLVAAQKLYKKQKDHAQLGHAFYDIVKKRGFYNCLRKQEFILPQNIQREVDNLHNKLDDRKAAILINVHKEIYLRVSFCFSCKVLYYLFTTSSALTFINELNMLFRSTFCVAALCIIMEHHLIERFINANSDTLGQTLTNTLQQHESAS